MPSHHQIAPITGVSLLALCTALAAGPALAQDADTITLETVVITGENLTRDLKETPTSVTVIGAGEIEQEKQGKGSITEVVQGTANVIYPDNVSLPIIRGIDAQGPHNGATAFFGGTVPRATINLDGHYLSYNEAFFSGTTTWDVESVEVFRGPQTTSQGANAIAGAIMVRTKDPSFTPEAGYQLEAGSYNQRRASLMWSGPIAEDLAARVALDYSARDTFIKYTHPAFLQNGTDQDFLSKNARLKLLWTPKEITGLEVKLTYAHNASNRPTYEAAAEPFDKLEHRSNTMPSWDQRTNTGILDIGYDMGNGFKITSQSQYSKSAVARHTGIVDGGDAYVDTRNASNETRLTYGLPEDQFSAVAGIYYARTHQDEELQLAGRFGNRSNFDDRKTNLGIFAEANWRLAEQWTLSGGLRYQEDQIRRKGTSSMSAVSVDFDTTYSKLLPKLSLAYDATPDWTLGAMVSRGYNPGGVSLNFTTGQWGEFKEESIWNYELFTRASLMEDRLFLTGNLFYMDFRNAQYNIPVEISPGNYQSYTINAEKAKSYGFEVSADYQVTEALMLRASAGALKTRISEISSNAALQGNEFARSPGFTLALGANWDVNDRFQLGGQVRHVDGYYSDTANTAIYAVDGYTIADVHASYKVRNGVELYGYVNNLFNERAAVSKQNNRGIGGIEASMTSPRMIGLGLRGTF
ncbi:TonB-dependent receptor [Paracoccus aminophilus]|uniref:TonB-dependent siderophore receptor n=1 Tax=Paracoccus aminophilus JCM 7686 TaxID=1367847 RepID=S5Y3R2_PARAH|nr:TonB-dependent receptor [Paracoccus aminophilus]AGT10385.1 TonB-dependent siderophore receptor [Paracoccus aminophilus JCM 7686]